MFKDNFISIARASKSASTVAIYRTTAARFIEWLDAGNCPDRTLSEKISCYIKIQKVGHRRKKQIHSALYFGSTVFKTSLEKKKKVVLKTVKVVKEYRVSDVEWLEILHKLSRKNGVPKTPSPI